jgi:GNAT superfamily N-acetyltransferase
VALECIEVRRLTAEDEAAASRIAARVFRDDPFYRAALGFDARAFDSYWRLFLPLAIEDPAGRVYAIESAGRLLALLIASQNGFPSPGRGLIFLLRLVLAIGPRRSLRYLRFVAAYDDAMRRSPAERRCETRGLWLMTAPGTARAGLGLRLVREAIRRQREEGRTIYTGFASAADPRLLDFYRRLGFRVSEPFPFAGGVAATIEHRGGG